MARRATATATRRAPRFWTSSTVWYSGIFAVAATLDLGVKQQRREQWNKAIADVKQDLERTDDVDANRDFLDSLEQETVASQEMRENLDSSAMRPRVPEWPASTGQERLSSRLPPQSIYTDNRKKAKHMLDRWNPKKMERVQLSVDALQLGFFMELHRHGWHEEAASAVPAWYAEIMLQPEDALREIAAQKHLDLNEVFHLKGKYSFGGENDEAANAEFARWRRSPDDVPLCNYAQDELGQFHSTAHDLNTTLRHLFDMGRNRVLSQPAVLAKVFHNLSVSSAPPNIDTFSTLIVGLSDIGTRRLVEDCIDALQCTKIRHNEVSLTSILNYWTLTGNEDEFHYLVQLMRGKWGGLSLAQPGVKITDFSQRRVFLKREDDIRVIQRPSPTPMVFNALINGVTKFSSFQTALSVCEAAREEGWGVSTSGLHHLLKDCSRRRDWTSGLATWKQILALRNIAETKFEKGTSKTSSVIDLPTFATMLQLCTRCNNRTAFQDTMQQAIAIHPNSATDLIRMVRLERSEMQISDQKTKSVADKLTPTSDISKWLEKQDIYRYANELKKVSWKNMITLNEEELKAMGVNSDDARNKLLEIFRQVRKAVPSYEEDVASWLPIAISREHRKLTLERSKSRKEERQWWEDYHKRWKIKPTISQSVEPEGDAAHGAETPQPKQSQEVQIDELPHVQNLETAVELDQDTNYAVDIVSIPDRLDSSYQPFGH